VLSSIIKANIAIIKETKDKRPIPTKNDKKNKLNLAIPNHGKTPKKINITIQQNIPTIKIFIRFLKKV